MPRTIPQTIRNLLGVNRRDGADKIKNNEFFSLQNWLHTTKGLLTKRSGTIETLPNKEFFGFKKVTGLYDYTNTFGQKQKLYYGVPNTKVVLPQPTTDLTLVDDATTGDLFNGGAVEDIRICYTWVGMGMESNYNTLTRTGFVTPTPSGINAWDQVGHQLITVANNTRSILITVPTMPKGVKSANIFVARGVNSQMVYVATVVKKPVQTFLLKAFVGPGAARNDTITAALTTLDTSTGFLDPGVYHISMAWFTDSQIKEGVSLGAAGSVAVNTAATVILQKKGNITVKNSKGTSSNGATHAYVFIGTTTELNGPMFCVGVIKTDNVDSVTLGADENKWGFWSNKKWGVSVTGRIVPTKFPINTNTQSTAAEGTPRFNATVPVGPSANTNRFGSLFVSKKLNLLNSITEVDENVGEIIFSRSSAYLNDVNIVTDNTIKTKEDRIDLVDTRPVPIQRSNEDLVNYLDPSFTSYNGFCFFVNGANYILRTDGYVLDNQDVTHTAARMPVPNLIMTFDSSLVIAGGACKAQIFSSNALSVNNWVVGGAGTDLRFMTVGDAFGDPVSSIGIFSYTTGTAGPESFFIAQKKTSTWSFSNLPDSSGVQAMQNNSGKIGTLAYRSFVATDIGTVFLGTDGDIYLLRESGEPFPIAGKVKPIFSHLAKDDLLMRKVTATFHQGFFKISFPSSSTSEENDAQMHGDFRTKEGDPIVWSGPHIGINIGPQITLSKEGETEQRTGALSDELGLITLDDPSTFLDLGSPIVSKVESKTYRYQNELQLKRIMSIMLDVFFDTQFTHSMLIEGFADANYSQIDKKLSTGGATWDESNFDQSNFSDALFFPVHGLFGSSNLLGRTFKFNLTHSDNAQIILAAMITMIKLERRIII